MHEDLSYGDIDALGRLADVLKGLSNTSRLCVLLAMYDGQSMQEVAQALGITRGGLQRNIETLIEADLAYRPANPEETYALTPLGEFFVEWLRANSEQLLEAVSIVDETEEDLSAQTESIRQQLTELSDADVDSDIDPSRVVSERELDRMVHTQKWEEANDEVADRLTPGPDRQGSRSQGD